MADPCVVGLDVGGTHSRAVLATVGGRVLGTGRAGGGNPTVLGAEPAIANIVAALRAALGPVPGSAVEACVMGLAGVSTLMADPKAPAALEQAWSDAGLTCPVRIVSDVTVSFAAGTPHPDGTLLVSGTGAVAARMHDRLPALFRDGYGWLLGDEGSGFWIGRQAARATIAAADGRAPMAELAKAVLEALLDQGLDAQGPDSSPTTGRTGSATSGRTWPESGFGLGVRGTAGTEGESNTGSTSGRESQVTDQQSASGSQVSNQDPDARTDQGSGSNSGSSFGSGSNSLSNSGSSSNPGSSSGSSSDSGSSSVSNSASGSNPGSTSGSNSAPSSDSGSSSVSNSASGSNPGSTSAPSSDSGSTSVSNSALDLPDLPRIGEAFTLRGRRRAAELVRAVAAQPTVALARLAPLVMAAYELGDPAAHRIVEEAARALVDSLAGVDPVAGEPVVLGGSVLVSRSPVFEVVAQAVRRRWPDSPIGLAYDGAAGATWLAACEVLGARDAALVHAAFTAASATAV